MGPLEPGVLLLVIWFFSRAVSAIWFYIYIFFLNLGGRGAGNPKSLGLLAKQIDKSQCANEKESSSQKDNPRLKATYPVYSLGAACERILTTPPEYYFGPTLKIQSIQTQRKY